jgi:SAM-dependent methyltransferase
MSSFDGWNDRLVQSYDLIAERYADHRLELLARARFDTELLDRYAESVRDRGRVCDLGCGVGVVASYLAERGVDVFGVDASIGMITVARNHYPDIPFQQGDMRALALPAASLAGVVAFYSILHIARPVVPLVLTEIMRVLRPGGLVLIAAYEGEGEDHTDRWLDRPVSLDTTFVSAGRAARTRRRCRTPDGGPRRKGSPGVRLPKADHPHPRLLGPTLTKVLPPNAEPPDA